MVPFLKRIADATNTDPIKIERVWTECYRDVVEKSGREGSTADTYEFTRAFLDFLEKMNLSVKDIPNP